MKRLNISRNDGLNPVKVIQDVMVAAFTGGKDKLVMVLINYTQQPRSVIPDLKNFKSVSKYRAYVTSASADDNLKPTAEQKLNGPISLMPRSVTTLVFN